MSPLKKTDPYEADDATRDRVGRRGFLEAVTAAFALAGADGCRRSVEHIVPYGSAPETLIPGRPQHYATVLARRGEALGLIVESHEGRPTKIEGNPFHPASMGGADLIAQASILDLYDPDRSSKPLHGGAAATWEVFLRELDARLEGHRSGEGRGLAVLAAPTMSPTEKRLREAFVARFPSARIVEYAPASDTEARRGGVLAFGRPVVPVYAFDRARVVVSLDADFLLSEPGNVRAQHLFPKGRLPGPDMSRLYVVEPAWTTTGMSADHRLSLPSTQVAAYAAALARELARAGLALGPVAEAATAFANESPVDVSFRWLSPVARDLVRAGSSALVVAGSRQPAFVHALAHAINGALGNEGVAVTYRDADTAEATDGAAALVALTQAMRVREVQTLVILAGNPAYDAPADAGFADALGKVPFAVHLSPLVDETSRRCTWHVPMTHELEAWGDRRSLDGTVAVQQPLIAPLFGGKSELELWAALAGVQGRPLDWVRATHREPLLAAAGLRGCSEDAGGFVECVDANGRSVRYPSMALERDWKAALRDGVVRQAARSPAPKVELDAAGVALALRAASHVAPPTRGHLEVAFAIDSKMLDGRHANNSWLQELPDPITKLAWGNAAVVSPATARELDLRTGDVLQITRGDRSVEVPALVVAGTADHTIVLSLGWGRTDAGKLGTAKGVDVYPLRTSDAMWAFVGATATPTGARQDLARTQLTDSMEGRPLARMGTLEEYMARPHFAEMQRPPRRSLPLWTDVDYSKGHQWGMAIDLNACTGCSACVVACQAENNIPVVGKEEVLRGRDMQWLRLDRYFIEDGAGASDPLAIVQPVTCVQCEEAPCENVCPVAALEHSAEGLSEVTYNRCIGTRYCANNCPYKVRRFNYKNWHNDGIWAERGGLPETLQMQQNPDVTVRFRGVIEKCTYCVQRIQERKLQSKESGQEIQDGDIVTACQQTCPSKAIAFGDLNDLSSEVSRKTVADRRYGLLEELGTKPRTTYLARVRNPNPEVG